MPSNEPPPVGICHAVVHYRYATLGVLGIGFVSIHLGKDGDGLVGEALSCFYSKGEPCDT